MGRVDDGLAMTLSNTKESPMERMDLHVSKVLKIALIISGVMSLGMMPFAFWVLGVPRRSPKALDPEGVTLRNGERYEWGNVTNIDVRRKRVALFYSYIAAVILSFGKKRVAFAPHHLQEGQQIFPYLNRVLGKDITAIA